VIGEAGCFALNAASFVLVILTFIMMRIAPSLRPVHPTPLWQGLREGVSYVWGSLAIRMLLVMLALVGLLGTPYMAMMPVLVKDVFSGGAEAMGFLVGAAGVGGFAGTVYLASRRHVRGLVGVIVRASFAAGAALAVLSWSANEWIAAALLGIVGFGILVTSVSVNMILQTIVDDDKRGRVMSFYTAAFLGVMPFGSLLAGTLADAIGVAWTLTAGGVGCAAAALRLGRARPCLREQLRPVYERLGIARR